MFQNLMVLAICGKALKPKSSDKEITRVDKSTQSDLTSTDAAKKAATKNAAATNLEVEVVGASVVEITCGREPRGASETDEGTIDDKHDCSFRYSLVHDGCETHM